MSLVVGEPAPGRKKQSKAPKKKKAVAQAPPSQDGEEAEDMFQRTKSFPSPTASQQAKDALVQVATALKSGKGMSTGFADSDEEEEIEASRGVLVAREEAHVDGSAHARRHADP